MPTLHAPPIASSRGQCSIHDTIRARSTTEARCGRSDLVFISAKCAFFSHGSPIIAEMPQRLTDQRSVSRLLSLAA